ncbi:toll/interleukin-1 receptor domain-containing protein [Niallia sp. FSL K6-0212]|uniref:toll/interleukin-1 receptor domain-containing protein n=1 Tax=Niallia sp. FSL K6-0212 TaxID=2921423 RepID=UPI0030FA7CC7
MGQVSDIKKVFISYSWDSTAHQQWVLELVYKLRDNGVDASIDILKTHETVNLNTMMVSNIRDNDYIIIVLTENYSKKADELTGGVGFETLLTIPLLLQNPQKLIFITRYSNSFNESIPFHLNGWYIIDFSGDVMDKPFKELLHRIEGIPLYEERPLGPKPSLVPQSKLDQVPKTKFANIKISNVKKVTDLDKEMFISNKFKELNIILKELLYEVQSVNPEFKFTVEEYHEKYIYKVFINGILKVCLSIWFTSNHKYSSIKIAYGNNFYSIFNGSYNEAIICEESNNNELVLKTTMNLSKRKNYNDMVELVENIWKEYINIYISF